MNPILTLAPGRFQGLGRAALIDHPMKRLTIAGNSMRPSFRRSAFSQTPGIPRLASRFCLLLSAFCLCSSADAASLLYQWDFNSPTGNNTTVTPAFGSGGVLTMSQSTTNELFVPDPPVATNLYSAAGAGVFPNSNPNDRAFDNSGALFDLSGSGSPGPPATVAGIVSSDNPPVTPAMSNTLSATAGSHAQITLTSWVRLKDGTLAADSNPILLAVGQQGYAGGTGSGITGAYLGFFNNFGQSGQINTLQFTANGAATGDPNGGVIGASSIIDQFKAGWMFVAVTYDSASISGNVQMYVGNKTASLGSALSTGTLAAGPANLTGAYAYIGNNSTSAAAYMDRGLAALIDDVRIYDGVLTQSQLDLVRQNLVITPGKGDFDFNGFTDVADIGAMMTALSDLPKYQASHGNMTMTDLVALGDFVDDHTVVDNLDLQGLINFVANAVPPGGGMLSAVPEPSTWLLFALGMFLPLHGKRARATPRLSSARKQSADGR
jgi:hypothetical protein